MGGRCGHQGVPAPLAAVAEGPCGCIRAGDALARASTGARTPTGDQQMQPRRIIDHGAVHGPFNLRHRYGVCARLLRSQLYGTGTMIVPVPLPYVTRVPVNPYSSGRQARTLPYTNRSGHRQRQTCRTPSVHRCGPPTVVPPYVIIDTSWFCRLGSGGPRLAVTGSRKRITSHNASR